MREAEFYDRLSTLLTAPVEGLDLSARLSAVRGALDALEAAAGRRVPACAFVPFVRGRRPADELTSPGLGSSEVVGLLLGDGAERDLLYLLYRVSGVEGLDPAALGELELRLSLVFLGADGVADPVPGWVGVPIRPQTLTRESGGEVGVRDAEWEEAGRGSFVIALDLHEALLPGARWSWDQAGQRLRAAATEPDPFSFGHAFHQEVEVSLRLERRGALLSATQVRVEVVDGRRLGSLYRRVLEDVVIPDTRRQAEAAGVSDLSHEMHPWYPVLRIGTDKADLYMRALIADIAGAGRFFSNPRWLLDVGLYLELLTCLGIFEAVKDDLGDALSPAERCAFEERPAWAPLREKLDVAAWRGVWEKRAIALSGVPRLGPVAGANLLRKREATLAFLHAHHDDLKWAIDLAGPNPYNAQESWHRVFRDAERAVLRQVGAAFPELDHVPRAVRHLVLWLRKGDLAPRGLGWVARPILGLFGDNDGLFVTACSQYRASMNDVADWARARRLMDHTGAECVPLQVSLLHSHMERDAARLARLQRHDGYGPTLEAEEEPQAPPSTSVSAVERLLEATPLFAPLTTEERARLAVAVRPISLAPMERILVQGTPGSSLFVVAEGELEVLRRQGETDEPVALLAPGAVFGELSLLTGAERSATVRSLEGAVVWEIGKEHLQPLVAERPALVDAFAELVEARAPGRGGERLRERVRAFLAG
ncbi:MAG: cyclic nucleotide-binding domain-containing protein [Planctomycetota bacterium]